MTSTVHTLFATQPAADSRFSEFWAVYPKKVGKPLAKAKFDAIVKGGYLTKTLDKDSNTFIDIELEASADDIIKAAKKYAAEQIDRNTYKLKDGGKFILHPASWLNKGRFLDE